MLRVVLDRTLVAMVAAPRRVGPPAHAYPVDTGTCISQLIELRNPIVFAVLGLRLRHAVVHDAVPRGVRPRFARDHRRVPPRAARSPASAATLPRAGEPPGPDAGARRAAFPDNERAARRRPRG